jgi:pfkB family carbohydrate kinase
VRFDYTTVGHVTVDVMPGGIRRPGGSAFYSALQAARLGKRALILTRGAGAEIEQLLTPFRGELELELEEAPCTTSLQTSGKGRERVQYLRRWAGEIGTEPDLDTEVLHIAPIARETPRSWRGAVGLAGLTPQGLIRAWSPKDGRVRLRPLEPAQLPERCDAAVLSQLERPYCTALLDRHGVVVVTDEAAPSELCLHDGGSVRLEVPAVAQIRDDIGAGDVFAAAFFIALAEGRDERAACAFANAAAAVRLSGYGPDAVGDRAAIEARMDSSG